MDEIDPRHLLIQIGSILDRLHIPYAVTGGMAVFVWARPRFTADIDIVVVLEQKHLAVLEQALRELHKAGYIDADMIRTAVEQRGEFNFIDGVTGVKVDFWPIGGQAFDQSQISRRIAREVLGHQIYFVSPEDLILSKLRWFREGESSKQREDIESILKMQQDLDWGYLKRWAEVHATWDMLGALRSNTINK